MNSMMFDEMQLYQPPVSFSHTFWQGFGGTLTIREVPLWERRQRLVKRLVDTLLKANEERNG